MHECKPEGEEQGTSLRTWDVQPAAGSSSGASVHSSRQDSETDDLGDVSTELHPVSTHNHIHTRDSRTQRLTEGVVITGQGEVCY